MMRIIAPDPPGPYLQFHEAQMTWSGHFLGIAVGITPLVCAGYVLATTGLPENPGGWFLVGLWLAFGIPFTRVYAATLLRIKNGTAAGIQVGEGDDYLEIAFLTGTAVCWVKRFVYAEVTGHGVGEFNNGQSCRHLPFVATSGILGRTIRHSIPLGAFCDLRRAPAITMLAIAADLERIMSRHGHGEAKAPELQ